MWQEDWYYDTEAIMWKEENYKDYSDRIAGSYPHQPLAIVARKEGVETGYGPFADGPEAARWLVKNMGKFSAFYVLPLMSPSSIGDDEYPQMVFIFGS
jgi:hypothetical protein